MPDLRKPSPTSHNEGAALGPFPNTTRGRIATLGVLDTLLNEATNKQKLRDAFQQLFDANPVNFFKNIVMPLLPKTMEATLSAGSATNLTPDQLVAKMDLLTSPNTNGYRQKLNPGFVEQQGRLNGRNPDGSVRVHLAPREVRQQIRQQLVQPSVSQSKGIKSREHLR